MAPNAIALQMQQNLDAEAEADRLLGEEDAKQLQAAKVGGVDTTIVEMNRKRIDSAAEEEDDDAFRAELEDLERSENLMSTPSGSSTPAINRMHPAPIIAIWIFLSSSVILFNAKILGTKEGDLHFPYPIFLTTVHMFYGTIGTRLMARFTHLVDGLNSIDMAWDRWLKNIVPIGALFSASLIFSNLAYLTLPVSYIQMLKAFTSVAVLTMSVVMGLEQFNKRTTAVVCAISFGVFLASYGEANLWVNGCQGSRPEGIILAQLARLYVYSTVVSSQVLFSNVLELRLRQLGLCTSERPRLRGDPVPPTFLLTSYLALISAIQKLLQGLRMNPLVSLYYYAPVCALLNLLLVPIFEGYRPFEIVLDRVGPMTLFVNCNLALLLNVSVVYLIGCASSLVLTLSGVLKDVILVAGSVLLFGSPVSFTQMFGYSIALGGLVVFKTSPEVMANYIAYLKAQVGR